MRTQTFALQNIKTLTDGELIAKAIRGREDGFEELVRRYQRPITGYVYRMLNNYDASLDVTQKSLSKFTIRSKNTAPSINFLPGFTGSLTTPQ